MATRTYRFLRTQGDELHVGEETMDEADAYGLMAVERTLHVLGGWDTTPCPCGQGFHACRSDVVRQTHIVSEDDLLEAGLLAPASAFGLVVVDVSEAVL
jgi:hypothetical protein